MVDKFHLQNRAAPSYGFLLLGRKKTSIMVLFVGAIQTELWHMIYGIFRVVWTALYRQGMRLLLNKITKLIHHVREQSHYLLAYCTSTCFLVHSRRLYTQLQQLHRNSLNFPARMNGVNKCMERVVNIKSKDQGYVCMLRVFWLQRGYFRNSFHCISL